ncbi:hypothetical protein ACFL23_05020 [Patescibacteria group bacterium]
MFGEFIKKEEILMEKLRKEEGGFVLLKLIIVISIAIFISCAGYYLGIKKICENQSSNKVIKKEVLSREIHKATDKIFLEDLIVYKKGGIEYGDFFENTFQKCKEIGCIKQSVVYNKYKILIENMKDNAHFLSAVSSLGADNNFHLGDIDNDGENEIVFLMYDPLNRDHVTLSIIDEINNQFEIIEKNIEWGHAGHFNITDLTGDLKPEIIAYISFGKGGESLFVYQYNYSEFKEIFNVRDLLYPEYTFSDLDGDGKMEIRVVGEDHDAPRDYRANIKRVYEYAPKQNSFILIDSEITEILN